MLTTILAFALCAAPEPQLSADQLRAASTILSETWSPFCPGKTLASCSSPQAAEWREEVRGWLAEGLTRAEIMAKLQTRKPGFRLETEPEPASARMGPWVLGGLFIFALGVLLRLHGRSTEEDPEEEVQTQPNDEAAQLVARELEALED